LLASKLVKNWLQKFNSLELNRKTLAFAGVFLFLQLINYFIQKKSSWEEAIKKPLKAKDLKVLLAKADQLMALNQKK
jgi:hypothetical protein